MNWIIKCNQLEKETKEVVYESCCELIDSWENFINSSINYISNNFSEIESSGFSVEKLFKKEILISMIEDNGKDYFREELFDVEDKSQIFNMEYYDYFCEKIISQPIQENNELLIKCNDIYYENVDKIKNFLLEITRKCMPYVKNERELHKMCKRISLFSRSIDAQFKNLKAELVDDFGEDFCSCVVDLLKERIHKNSALIKSFVSENLETKEEQQDLNDNSNRLKKIFDYKEMESLAIKNGFVYKWSNGSHNIYEHVKSNKIVVIPAHYLGIGLSIKIQKQIYFNKN